MNFFLFLVVGILGGTTGSLIKYAVLEIPPIPSVAIRFGVSLIFLLPFVLNKGISVPKSKRNLLLLSSVCLAANVLLFAIGIQYTSAIMGQLIYLPTSVIVAILGYFFLKEKLTINQIVGLILTIVGILILALGSIETSDIHNFGKPLGNILIFIGLFVWSSYLVLSRKIVKDYSPLLVTFYNTSISLALFIIFALIEIKIHPYNLNSMSTPSFVALISAAGTSVLFIFLYQKFLKTTSAFIVSFATYLNPLAATVIGITVFGEKLTFNFLLGGLIIFVGVFLATSYNYIQGKVSKK